MTNSLQWGRHGGGRRAPTFATWLVRLFSAFPADTAQREGNRALASVQNFLKLVALIVLCVAFLPCAGAGEPEAVSAQAVSKLISQPQGAAVIDIGDQPTESLAQGIPGLVHIKLEDLSKVGIPKDRLIVLIDDQFGSARVREGAGLLTKAGFDKVAFLDGGMPMWRQYLHGQGTGDALTSQAVSPAALATAVANKDEFYLVDLRSEYEFHRGSIPGAINVMPNELLAKAASWDKSKWVVLFSSASGRIPPLENELIKRQFVVGYVDGGYEGWLKTKPEK
jgi:rhodanese-related sulfurtransferase